MSNKFTGIKYSHEVGFYAVLKGKIVCDWSVGISGTLASAEMDLAAAQNAQDARSDVVADKGLSTIDWRNVDSFYVRCASEPGYWESLYPWFY